MSDESTTYTILLYHGVHEDSLDVGPRNRSGKHIAAGIFDDQMRHLASTRSVVSFADIVLAHRGEADLPPDAVAVSFDDGFLNNYAVAWPILERHRVPAIFYLATGFIGTGRMIWSDLLEASLLAGSDPTLEVEFGDRLLEYTLNSEADRITAFLDIKARCKMLPNIEKNEVVDAVVRRMQAELDPAHQLYSFMSWDQAREMDQSDLVEFGAHTIDHVSLANVALPEMRRQIDESVRQVAHELGHPCEFFSYPEGQPHDFNDDVIGHLRTRGFDHAPTAIDGDNTVGGTDPFHMRRVMVGFEGREFPL